MIEEKILQALDKHVEDNRLHFQIIIRKQKLYIYINRDTEEYLDYSHLTCTIESAIAELEELDFSTIELFSRAMGEIEPDWQTSVEVINNNSSTESMKLIDDAIINTKSLISQAKQELNAAQQDQSDLDIKTNISSEVNEYKSQAININQSAILPEQDLKSATVDFSQYCFTRNKLLLNADLVAPQENIARLVDTFHKFEIAIKQSQLPLLEIYLTRGQEPEISNFEQEIQSWWTEILVIDDNSRRKLAIWLSRYCFDVENTMATIENVFISEESANKVIEEQVRQEAKKEREAKYNTYKQHSQKSQQITRKSTKAKPSIGSWISYILVIFVIRLISSGIFNHVNFNSHNEIVEPNPGILAEYSQEELNKAKKLADISLKRYLKQDKDDALQYTEEALGIFPKYSRAYFNRGHLKEKKGDLDGAIVDYTTAIEMYPDNLSPLKILYQAYNNRGLVFQELGNYDSALDDAEKAIDLIMDEAGNSLPDKAGYYANRGLAYLGLEDYENAIADQTLAIEMEPNKPGWYYNRGQAHRLARNYQKALEDLDKAIELNPFFGWAYRQRYLTHLALGNWVKANLDKKKAKSLGVEI